MKEVWKNVIGYEGLYEVSSLGNIYSNISKKILKINRNKDGYLSIELWNKGKNKRCKIHRLVAIAFICNPLNKREVNHKNGIKSDNRIQNLEWVTKSENEKHAYRTGLKYNKGEKHSQNILKENDIPFIIDLLRNKVMYDREIGELFGVTRKTINKIKLGKSWKHVNRGNY